MTVAAILRQKGTDVAQVSPDTTVADVARRLRDKRIGAILVLDGENLVGIVSERDIVANLATHGASTLEMSAADIMTRSLHTVTPRSTLPEAMAQMTNRRVRHLPVLVDGRLVGIVSIGDIVKARLDAQEQEVDSLKAYVAGAA